MLAVDFVAVAAVIDKAMVVFVVVKLLLLLVLLGPFKKYVTLSWRFYDPYPPPSPIFQFLITDCLGFKAQIALKYQMN